MFYEGITWRCKKEREHLIIAFQWRKQKSSTDMIIEFGLDGQNLCDPTAVFSKPSAWLLIHVLRFVSFAHRCIWKWLITLQAYSIFLCYYFFLSLLQRKTLGHHFFSALSSLTQPSKQVNRGSESKQILKTYEQKISKSSSIPRNTPRNTGWGHQHFAPHNSMCTRQANEMNGSICVALSSRLGTIWMIEPGFQSCDIILLICFESLLCLV